MRHALLTLLAASLLAIGLAGSTVTQAAPKPSRQVETDLSKLPERVREMHQRILEAARSGDIEALRPVLESNELMPTFSFGKERDAIAYWKELSDDKKGREILAVLVNILSMPYVRLRAGTSDEMYVWPYLFEADLEKLPPGEEVDLYRLVTPEEARIMKEYGAYIWYRLGIGPDGTWHFFVAGD
jgi:hypothetical protein